MRSIIYIYYTYIGIGENIRFFRFGVLFSENIEQNMEKKLIKPMSKKQNGVSSPRVIFFVILTRWCVYGRVVNDRRFSAGNAIAFTSRESTGMSIRRK